MNNIRLLLPLSKHLPDRQYISLLYRLLLKRRMDFSNPVFFSEKLQVLKLSHDYSRFSYLSDKYLVRDYVKKKIGQQYLIPTFGVFDDYDSIPFYSFPEKLVVKATHGSGWNHIKRSNENAEFMVIKNKITTWLKENYFYYCREPVYKDLYPRVICDELLVNHSNANDSINDYKFYCFNGEVELIQVDIDRFISHKRNFYNLCWEFQPLSLIYPNFVGNVKRPNNLDEMISLSKTLSSGFNFVRVDLYSVNNRVYFGEMTFFPEGGFCNFYPIQWDKVLGSKLIIR